MLVNTLMIAKCYVFHHKYWKQWELLCLCVWGMCIGVEDPKK